MIMCSAETGIVYAFSYPLKQSGLCSLHCITFKRRFSKAAYKGDIQSKYRVWAASTECGVFCTKFKRRLSLTFQSHTLSVILLKCTKTNIVSLILCLCNKWLFFNQNEIVFIYVFFYSEGLSLHTAQVLLSQW